jgi:hypothetical protein
MKRIKNGLDVRDALRTRYSKEGFVRIREQIGADPERFAALMKCFLSNEQDLVLRASWLMSMCAERRPDLLRPWLGKMLRRTEAKDAPEALQRNVVRALQFVDIPRAHQGRVVELCLGFLQDPKGAIAVRAFSMTVLEHIARQQPELKQEIILIIEQMLPYGSAGIRSRARTVLRQLRK